MSEVNTSETGTTTWSQAASFSSADDPAASARPRGLPVTDPAPSPAGRREPADEPYEKRWLALARHRRDRPAGHPRRDDRQHRPAGRLGRPGHRRGDPAVDRHRLHADLRRLPAARRPDRRLLGPQAHLPGRARPGSPSPRPSAAWPRTRRCCSAPARCRAPSARCWRPASLALLTVLFTDTKERAKAFAVYGAIAGGGSAVGLLLGGVLTEYADWRWCFWVNLPVAILAIVAAIPIVPESKAPGDTSYDIPGAVLITLGLASFVYGFTRVAQKAQENAAAGGQRRQRLDRAVGAVLHRRRRPARGGVRRPRAADAQPAAADADRARPQPRRRVPDLDAGRRRADRGVLLPQPLLPAGARLHAGRGRLRLAADHARRAHLRRCGQRPGAQGRARSRSWCSVGCSPPAGCS